MKLSVFAGCGDYYVGVPWDQKAHRWHSRDILVVPQSIYDDAVKLDLTAASPEPSCLQDYGGQPYFSTAAPAPFVTAWSNVFEPRPLTRRSVQETARSLMPLSRLLASLRQEAVLLSIASLRCSCPRIHPRNAVLAALSSASCQFADIVEALGRQPRVVDKWLQRLRREGFVGYRRDIGYYLRADNSADNSTGGLS